MQQVSCFQVFKKLCRAPRNQNIFCFVLDFLLYTILILASLGILYLWCVPLTNVIGKMLFADFKCYPSDNIWGACGRVKDLGRLSYEFSPDGTVVAVGFLIFLMIQSSIGALFLAPILYIWSRFYGHLIDIPVFPFSCCFTWHERKKFWRSNTPDVEYSHESSCFSNCGPLLAVSSIKTAIVGIFFLTIYIGIWGGRAIAMQVHPDCIPFRATQLGFYGCVDVDGKYVGGETCKNCAGIGFAILGIPLFFLHFLVALFCVCIYKFVKVYKHTKRELEEIAISQVPIQSQPLDINSSIDSSSITRKSIDDCAVCLEYVADIPIACGHKFCSVCITKLIETQQTCPLCRAPMKN